MAKAFAHMDSEDQAKFLALVHDEMRNYPVRDDSDAVMGSHGRELQMLAIKDHFDDEPDAAEFIRTLYEMTHDVPAPDVPFTLVSLKGAEGRQSATIDNNTEPGPLFTEKELSEVGLTRFNSVDVIETTVEYPGVEPLGVVGDLRMSTTTQPRITVRIHGRGRLELGDGVAIGSGQFGTVTQVHDDGTVTVVTDLGYLEPAQDGPAGDPGLVGAWVWPDLEPVKANEPRDVREPIKGRTPEEEERFKKLDGYGFVSHRLFPQTDHLDDIAPNLEPAKCSECRGTGFYTGMQAKEPCSQGCKP